MLRKYWFVEDEFVIKLVFQVEAGPALTQFDQLSPVLELSTLCCSSTHNKKHCRFYREPVSPTPSKAGPGKTICCKFVSYLQEVVNFLWSTTVSSTNKTEYHNITGILLKVALNSYMAYNSQKSLFIQWLIKSCILFCFERDDILGSINFLKLQK